MCHVAVSSYSDKATFFKRISHPTINCFEIGVAENWIVGYVEGAWYYCYQKYLIFQNQSKYSWSALNKLSKDAIQDNVCIYVTMSVKLVLILLIYFYK